MAIEFPGNCPMAQDVRLSKNSFLKRKISGLFRRGKSLVSARTLFQRGKYVISTKTLFRRGKYVISTNSSEEENFGRTLFSKRKIFGLSEDSFPEVKIFGLKDSFPKRKIFGLSEDSFPKGNIFGLKDSIFKKWQICGLSQNLLLKGQSWGVGTPRDDELMLNVLRCHLTY